MNVLIKTFIILNLFLKEKHELSLSDINKLSGLKKPTISRIVSILKDYGYLVQKEKRGKYSLGYKYFDFTGIIKGRMKIRDISAPYLNELSEALNESVILGIWDGRKAVITEAFHTNQRIRVIPDEGSSIELHCSAIGKIILANMKEKDFNEYYYGKSLNIHTERTINSIEALKKHLVTVKKEGFAVDDEEYIPNARSIAAGIKNSEGVVIGAIGLIGPSIRFTYHKIQEYKLPLQSCAMKISRDMGYTGQ